MRNLRVLKISISVIHIHLVHKHNITLKKLEKIPAARNSDRVIALPKAIIEQYKSFSLMKQVSIYILKETVAINKYWN